jgi:hypothetical protein
MMPVNARSDTPAGFAMAVWTQSNLGFRVPGKVIERLVDVGQVPTRNERLRPARPSYSLHGRGAGS